MPLIFDWSNVWSFYKGMDEELKRSLENEILSGGWFKAQPEKTRQEILKHAPPEILHKINSALESEKDHKNNDTIKIEEWIETLKGKA